MPFYLVTQTSLVEADGAQSAAESAIEHIRSGTAVTVSVMANETEIEQITVAAATNGGSEDRDQCQVDAALAGKVVEASSDRRGPEKPVIAKGKMRNILRLFRART